MSGQNIENLISQTAAALVPVFNNTDTPEAVAVLTVFAGRLATTITRDVSPERRAAMHATLIKMLKETLEEGCPDEESQPQGLEGLPVKYASDCIPCPDCGEPFCEECNAHYTDCAHPGPDSETEADNAVH